MRAAITLRRADASDCHTIREVACVAFPHTYASIISPEQIDYMMQWMYSPESLRRQIECEGHIYHIAYLDAKAVGYVSVQQESEGLFHLHKIYVLPDAQGRGVGRLLFEAALATVKRLHPAPCRVELNVNRHNSAVAFYERLGMHRASQGDFDIGCGFLMTDYIMAIDV